MTAKKAKEKAAPETGADDQAGAAATGEENASGGRGAAPDPAGGNDFPRTPSVGFGLDVSTGHNDQPPIRRVQGRQGPGGCGRSPHAIKLASTTERDVARVYCKLPAGMAFRLPGGGRVALNGANASGLAGAYGLTELPASQWEMVKAHFGGMPVFAKGLIFEAANAPSGLAMALERAALKTGFERVDPANPGPGLTRDDGR